MIKHTYTSVEIDFQLGENIHQRKVERTLESNREWNTLKFQFLLFIVEHHTPYHHKTINYGIWRHADILLWEMSFRCVDDDAGNYNGKKIFDYKKKKTGIIILIRYPDIKYSWKNLLPTLSKTLLTMSSELKIQGIKCLNIHCRKVFSRDFSDEAGRLRNWLYQNEIYLLILNKRTTEQ